MKDVSVGKNVGLKLRNLVLIQQYMFKTKRNFSKTLNIIIEEWDRFSLEIEKMKREMEVTAEIEKQKSAEVIKK